MSAERLREAAKVLRERAQAATPGPWGVIDEVDGIRAGQPVVVSATKSGDRYARRVVSVGQTRPHVQPAIPNVAYIATMHPGVGLALADWLDRVATHTGRYTGVMVDDALRVADLILGGTS